MPVSVMLNRKKNNTVVFIHYLSFKHKRHYINYVDLLSDIWIM